MSKNPNSKSEAAVPMHDSEWGDLGAVSPPAFIDFYAGCGGLSLGFMLAGWRGLFAIEKEWQAFATLKHNLIEGHEGRSTFDWPEWLARAPIEVSRLLNDYPSKLEALRGRVTAIIGGPPCQGYSDAGKRNKNDPRNKAYKDYIKAVGIARPALLLLENVKGITNGFGKNSRPHSALIKRELEEIDYVVHTGIVDASKHGVPHQRVRFFAVGIDGRTFSNAKEVDPFALLEKGRVAFLERRGLPVMDKITVKDALSDLETKGRSLIPCRGFKGFKQLQYEGSKTAFQKYLREGMNGEAPNSLRLVNHRPPTIARFKIIQQQYRRGIHLSEAERTELGIKKHTVMVLDDESPSFTITTLPDDNIHYSEPRILTVRENARLQSFPDWFAFKGKYTTGGKARVHEVPRYTQVGNAVPPVLASAWAECLAEILKKLHPRIECA